MEFDEYREAMVAQLLERGEVSERVAEAFRLVPRHRFLSDFDPEAAYRDEPIVTKRDAEGRPISSSSQPAIMGIMLDQLDVRPGHRVLEIGAGTGYNAALLAHLAGPEGRVVSVDIDADVVAAARRHLDAAAYPEVTVECADGAAGHPEAAPYDRVIATVGVWDLAPAWLEQLAPGGRLVVPLDLRGVQVSVAMEYTGGHWSSRSVEPCGFMRMRGPSAGPEVTLMLDGDADLVLTLPEPREVGDVLAMLDEPVAEVAADGMAPLPRLSLMGGGVGLWLALHEPRWGSLTGRLRWAPVTTHGYGMTVGIVGRDGLAVLAADEELRARGFGPGGAALAADLIAHVQAWDAAGRPEACDLRIDAYLGPAPEGAAVIAKRHTRLVLSYD
ncbi:methyltransferase, FxLD system [Nonomuraea aurantiaca]|uniref:methyltransferase, FxLD system n=1 Tax=Nonomuraea aurantiaca TaxID=2878562 RepID=UPI001CD9AE19|nr:methyltransferase, FxLD system [Nonomuraea aurantiaca]MCA2226517.1 methyltransferase, FxLD system [Nonomuraea aurantiaca]